MTWEKCAIGALVDRGSASIQTGPFGTQLKAKDYVSAGTPVINVRNIGFGQLRAEKLEYVGASITEKLAVHLLQQGDIVFGRKGAVERHLFVGNEQQNWMQGSDCIRLRFLDKSLEAHFVSYCFLSIEHQQWMITQAGNKATMASLNQDIIRRIQLCLPPVTVQKKIVEILKTYDDLIENNRRRIALLEESARLLYQEWFVQLRFPGCEHTRIVDGVPEGWKRTSIFDAVEVLSGGTPKTGEAGYWNGEIPFYTPRDSVKSVYVIETEKHVTEQGLQKCNSKLYPKNTLFITARGTVGNLNLAQLPMAMNQSCYALVGKDQISQFFLYCAIAASLQEFKQRAAGAVFDAIVVDTFKHIPFLLPPKSVVSEFTVDITPYFQQVETLLVMNRKLSQARDLLLPKLMSGEVMV